MNTRWIMPISFSLNKDKRGLQTKQQIVWQKQKSYVPSELQRRSAILSFPDIRIVFILTKNFIISIKMQKKIIVYLHFKFVHFFIADVSCIGILSKNVSLIVSRNWFLVNKNSAGYGMLPSQRALPFIFLPSKKITK